MSVGDIKGARRRIKVLKQKGHFPRPASGSIAQSIAKAKELAARMAKAARK